MQELISQISQGFNRHLSASLASIKKDELQNIVDKVEEYLVAEGSKTEDIELLKREFITNKFCGGYINIMHIAAKYADPNQLQSLIEIVGKDAIDVFDNENRTPLHHSAIGGVLENAVLLMNEGSNIYAKSSNETRNWLPIHYAVKSGNFDLVVEMIDRGVDPEITTAFGLNCLHIACEFDRFEIARYMLELELDVNTRTAESNFRMTPLHHATVRDSLEIVKLIIENGADRKIKDGNDQTCLDIAANMGFANLVDFFLQHGVVSYENSYKLAIDKGYDQIAQKIASYLLARDNLFNRRFLKNFSPLLEEAILLYKDRDFETPKISLENGVFINAHGIVEMNKSIGIFKKSDTNLIEFAAEIGLKNLEEALIWLKRSIYSASIKRIADKTR